MSKPAAVLLLAVLAVPLLGMAEDFKNVPSTDIMCSRKEKANPDAHLRSCALQCQKSGYGIYTQDGRFLKFDSAGNAKMLDLLKSSSKQDHIRLDVTGDVQGDTIKVQSLGLK